MVSLIKYGALSGGEKYNTNILEIDGLSTDTKPIATFIEYGVDGREIGRTNIENGSTFTEIDTGKLFMYDAENTVWYEIETSGGGGGGGTDNYNSLSNKPQINGTVLSGNKTSDNLGLQNKISATNKIDSDFVDDENSANKFMSETEKIKLASLVNYDDTEVKEDISDIETSLNSHKSDKTNPHEVTKAQVGLGNVDNTSDINKPISNATQAALDSKVSKVDGKGLSTNDFTNEDKNRVTITNGKNGFGRFLASNYRNWDFLFLYPCVFLEQKKIRIPRDFLMLDSRFSGNYKGTSAAIEVSWADITSSAVIIVYEVSSSTFKAFKFDTALTEDDYIPICTIRQTFGSVISNVPIYVDGKLFGVVDDNSKSFVRGINHRGFNRIAPENTIPAYVLSKKYGFDTVETDISFTSDNVPVLLHDDTVDRTSNGSGNIAGLTYAEVSALDFGSWKSAEYAGTKIPTFEEFVIFCRDVGLKIYAELKGTITQAQAKLVCDIVKKYHMEKNTSWISFSSANLSLISAEISSARLGFIIATATAESITTASSLKTSNNEVFLDCSSITDALIETCITAGIETEKWTINTESGMTSSNPYISGYTSDVLIAARVFNYYRKT